MPLRVPAEQSSAISVYLRKPNDFLPKVLYYHKALLQMGQDVLAIAMSLESFQFGPGDGSEVGSISVGKHRLIVN